MFYVMVVNENVATRYGRMFKTPTPAIRLATAKRGYVEQYTKGVYWTLKVGTAMPPKH